MDTNLPKKNSSRPWSLFSLLPLFVLAAIQLFIFISNYTPGTYLIGWDNLLPELNITANLKRTFISVWQQYQGLGLVGGMGHASDLFRQLFLFPLTFILPNNFIRYFWHFFMMSLGTFGIYFLLLCHFHKPKIIAFTASLFYLLNLGSIQYFWAPYEAFSTFWGFFPWLILVLLNLLSTPNKKTTLIFVLVNLLATPSFYVPTLFIVYLICIVLILLPQLFINHKSYFINLKIILLIIFINAFWLLPFLYFFFTNSHNPQLAISNILSSQETFARNQKYGTLLNFLTLRNYYLDFPGTNGLPLMSPWIDFFQNPVIHYVSLTLGIMVVIGFIFFSPGWQRLLFLFIALGLLPLTPPFSWLNSLLRASPLLNQVFRAPFTKLIVPASFIFSILYANFLDRISKKSKLFPGNFLLYFFPCLSIGMILLLGYPVFEGKYISPDFRKPIPPEYFQLFDYFKDKPVTARIMNLPQGDFWGWTNYRNGLSGSGFIWYGLNQPVLDRTFDVWSLKNEQYYWELASALQRQDPLLIRNVLDKYSVSYVIFDNNVFFPGAQIYSKIAMSTPSLLEKIPGLRQTEKFGPITVYRYEQSPTQPYVITGPVTVSPYTYLYTDTIFQKHSDYIVSPNPDVTYPFIDLFSNRIPSELKEKITVHDSSITISYATHQYTFDFDPNSVAFINHTLDENHSLFTHPKQAVFEDRGATFVRFQNSHQSEYVSWNYPNVTFNESYLVRIRYRHLSGFPLKISIFDSNNHYKFTDTQLTQSSDWTESWFVIPSQEVARFNSGLTVYLNSPAFTQTPSINDVRSIDIYPIDYTHVAAISNPLHFPETRSQKTIPESRGSFNSYRISLTSAPNSFLVLPQAYDNGWQAYVYQNGKKIYLSHVLANNWANAWQLPDSLQNQQTTVYLIFGPQYLQYLGFALLAFATLFVLLRPDRLTSKKRSL